MKFIYWLKCFYYQHICNFDIFYSGAFIEYLVLVAKDSKTSKGYLEYLSYNGFISVRAEIARNPNTPIDVLERLSDDENYNVRKILADNNNIPERLANKLLFDKSWEIRRSIIYASKASFKSLREALLQETNTFNKDLITEELIKRLELKAFK